MTDPSTDASLQRKKQRRRRRRIGFLVAAVPAAIIIVVFIRNHHDYKHVAVHEPGKVYRCGWVEPDVMAELVQKHNVRTVINLCNAHEKGPRIDAERQAVEAAGGSLVEVEFPPNYTWDTSYPAVEQLEELYDDPRNYPILVHCWHGRERTAKALAIYDIRKRGMTAADSLHAMPRFGMPHPWPVVAFAFSYETKRRERDHGDATPREKATTAARRSGATHR